MKQNGSSLIELLVVIAIIGVLLTIATINFRDWSMRYNIESQVNEMYVDFANARIKATSRNRLHFISLSSDQYTVTEDSDNNGTREATDALVISKKLKNLMAWTGDAGISFDSRGLASLNKTVSVSNTVSASYDCISVSITRIGLGKMSGGSCVTK